MFAPPALKQTDAIVNIPIYMNNHVAEFFLRVSSSTFINSPAHPHTHTRTPTPTHAHPHTHTRTHTCMHTRTRARAHTHTHTHTYTHRILNPQKNCPHKSKKE